jgi:formate dehydrogenase beta subunit
MNKIVFSSWAGKVVDNRGLAPENYASIDNLDFPLTHDGHQLKAFMSWLGLVVTDKKISVIDMARAYIKEVEKLSCGECVIGYFGVKACGGLLKKIANGQGTREDLDSLRRLVVGIRANARCDFCSLAVTPVLHTLDYYGSEYLKLIANQEAAPKSDYKVRVSAPCMEACPTHQDVPGYIELILNNRFPESLAVIRHDNCLPGVIGRACVAFCEKNCVRGDIDSPIRIRALKRVPADYEIASGEKPKFQKKRGTENKVAVIGAGPAGLAASYNLALMGYKVTVFDEQCTIGGMALLGVPAYRLPKDILKNEGNIIEGLGIEFKLNTKVGRDITLEQLEKEHKAIFVAIGAHVGREFDIENWEKDYDGLVDGIEFLRDANLCKDIKVGNKVIVVGGGNVAIDCAQTCRRLGSKNVTVMYRRSRVEITASAEEIVAAEEEGVKLELLAVPVKVLVKGNKVAGTECIRMRLGEPDASGRRTPVPIKGSGFVAEADMIIAAVGEMPDLSLLPEDKSITITKQGTIMVNLPSYQTSRPGIFSGGDCATGPASLIEAVAAGNRAARSIDQYLRLGKVTATEDDMLESWLHNVALSRRRDGNVVHKRTAESPAQRVIAERVTNFNEVEQRFTLEEATKESERCLRCYRVMMLAIS